MAAAAMMQLPPAQFDAKAPPPQRFALQSVAVHGTQPSPKWTESPVRSVPRAGQRRPRSHSDSGGLTPVTGTGVGSPVRGQHAHIAPAKRRSAASDGSCSRGVSRSDSPVSVHSWRDGMADELMTPVPMVGDARKHSCASSVECDSQAPATVRVSSGYGEWTDSTTLASADSTPPLPGTPSHVHVHHHAAMALDAADSRHHDEIRSAGPPSVRHGSSKRGTTPPRHRPKPPGLSPLSRETAAQSFIVHRFQQSSYLRIEHNRLSHSGVKFHVGQFFEQMLLQSVPPLGMLLIWFWYGRQGLKNAEMWFTQPRFYMQVLTCMLVTGSALAYLFVPSMGEEVGAETVITLVFTHLAFRAVIALKYAHLPPSRYRMWYHHPSDTSTKQLDPIVRQRENLLVWMKATEEHVRAELRYTAMRLGVCLHQAAFSVVKVDAASDARGAHRVLLAPREKWKLLDAITEVMRKSMSGSLMKPLSLMCLAFALLHGFVASGLVAMMSGSRPWPKDACCWAMVIGVAVVSALLVHLIAMFACCAFVDYQRRYLALSHLEHLVSYHPKVQEKVPRNRGDYRLMATDDPPKVSLLITENVHMFLLARRVLLNIGLRYRKRLQAYTSFLVVLLFGDAVYFMVSGVGGSLRPSTMVWLLVLDSAVIIFLLLVCLFKGSATNQLTERHTALLDARQLEAVDALASLNDGTAVEPGVRSVVQSNLLNCKHALAATTVQLKHDHALRAVTLVGARANPALIRNVLVFGTTVGSLVLRVLLAADGGSSY